MTNEEIPADQLLEQLFAVVLEEARTNSRFAQKLIEALPSNAVVRIETKKKSTSPRISKANEEPISLTSLLNRQGEDALRQRIKPFGAERLRTIIERQQIPVDTQISNSDDLKSSSPKTRSKALENFRSAIVEGVKFKIADRLAAAS